MDLSSLREVMLRRTGVDVAGALDGRAMCIVAPLLGWSSQGAMCAQPWLIRQEFMTTKTHVLTDKAQAALRDMTQEQVERSLGRPMR